MSKLSLDTTDTADTVDRVSSTNNTKVQDSFTQFPSTVSTQFSHLVAQVKAYELTGKDGREAKRRKLFPHARDELSIVNDSLEILSSFKYATLDRLVRTQIQEQALQVLRNKNAFWPYLFDTRVVSTFDENGIFQANHINVRSRPEFTTMLHHELGRDTMFCFMASEQLEPVVIVVVLRKSEGKIINLQIHDMEELGVAIQQFKVKYGLGMESYAYTSYEERARLQQHSRHFHLKIRIPTAMYLEIFPMMRTVGRTREQIQNVIPAMEPFNYKFNKQAMGSWQSVKDSMLKDTYTAILSSI